MDIDNKSVLVEELVNSFKEIMSVSISDKKQEKAMAAISAGCQVLYQYNQRYVDEDFENGILSIAKYYSNIYRDILDQYCPEKNTVLFYDGFGLDTRGVAKMYINALAKNGYRIIYAAPDKAKTRLPETLVLLRQASADIFFIETEKTYALWVKQLLDVIFKFRPKSMFFYTTPNDSAGATAFAVMQEKAERFLIDLTDHAFWLGTHSNDFFCGSREMSASNQIYERNIPREKLIKLGVNLIIDEGDDHSGLPFDVTSEKYIFSGGQLYKTLGDKGLLYYKIVDYILANHQGIKYLYAGSGDHSEMDKIIEKYPDRAFLIPERKDFYYLIKNCILYLNTYPMFGGMMMKYSANAGKLPITLKHENDSDGLLLDQESRKIEYRSLEELVTDIDRLLEDEEYLAERENLLKGSVISEERFVNNVRLTIEEHHTDYEHGNKKIDTSQFKKEFYDRFELDQVKDLISIRINKSLFINYPWMALRVLKRKLSKLVNN